MEKINQLRKTSPLIICFTNDVVKNFTANGLLALGVSPAMAEEPEEADAFLSVAGALLVNIGTINQANREAMLHYARCAKKRAVPVVLDPVAVGASPFRKTFVAQLLQEGLIDVIRGNASEIQALIDHNATMVGTDSDMSLDSVDIARRAFEQLHIPIVLTGKIDAIAAGGRLYKLSNGSAQLTRVTGGGCLLGAVIAAFVSGQKEINGAHLVEGISLYNIASEHAASTEKGHLPGHFQIALLDALFEMTPEIVERDIVMEVIR